MSNISNKLSALRTDVLAKSAEFAKRIQGVAPSILCDIGHYSNESFLLRAFVSLRSDNDSDELAMTVDITAQPRSDESTTISIRSDVCLDDGTVLAEGPSAEFESASLGNETAISSWNKEFDAFLKTSEVDVVQVLREMASKRKKFSQTPSSI
jgi:hypothetical protein